MANQSLQIAATDKLWFGVVSAITVALLIWVGSTLHQSEIKIGQLQVEVLRLRDDLRRASIDSRELSRRMSALEADVAQLKSAVDDE